MILRNNKYYNNNITNLTKNNKFYINNKNVIKNILKKLQLFKIKI